MHCYSSSQDEAAEKIKADRVKAYQEKKGKKPALIAKSSIVLDVKPWDDETVSCHKYCLLKCKTKFGFNFSIGYG